MLAFLSETDYRAVVEVCALGAMFINSVREAFDASVMCNSPPVSL